MHSLLLVRCPRCTQSLILHNCLFQCLLMFVAGALSALTRTPENVVVKKGDDVVMQCSTDSTTNTITWTHDGNSITTTPCASRYPSRYTVERPVANNDCFITALGSSGTANHGPYLCGDGTSSTSAEAIALLMGIQLSCCIHEISLLIFFFCCVCSSSQFECQRLMVVNGSAPQTLNTNVILIVILLVLLSSPC